MNKPRPVRAFFMRQTATNSPGRPAGGSSPGPRSVFDVLADRTRVVLMGVLAITAVLVVPFLAMAPTTSASTEPSGPIFDARDKVDSQFVSSVFDTPFVAEAEGGDVLRAVPLANLLAAQDELRADPAIAPTLVTWYIPEVGVDAVGTFGLADLVDRELRSQSDVDGLGEATDEQVKRAGGAVIDRLGVDSPLLSLSQHTRLGDDGTWIVPGVSFRVRSDDTVLGFGNRSINLGGSTAPEEYSRQLQTTLRSAEGWKIYGVAVDVNLTSAEQGALAGPFIGLAVLAALLMVGLMFRSYWVVAVVSSMFLILLIWLKGISNLIGLEDSTVLSLIVPIAMVSFGVDYAFHSIGRYREERQSGKSASRAAVAGTAAVSGALFLASASDSVAFLANISSGIDSVIQFGIGAAIALGSAWVLLGIVAPYAVAWIEAQVPAPRTGRIPATKRLAGTVGATALTTASVLMLVFVLPWAGVILAALTLVLSLVVPVRIQSRKSGARVGDVPPVGGTKRLGLMVGAVVAWVAQWRFVVLPLALLLTGIAASFATQVPTRFDVEDFFSGDSDFVVALDLHDQHVGDRRGEQTSLYIEGDLTDPDRLSALRGRLNDIRALETPNLARDDNGVRLFRYGVLEVLDAADKSTSMARLVQAETGVELRDRNGDAIPDTAEQVAALLKVASTAGIPAAGTDDQLVMTADDVAVRVNLDTEPHATVIDLGMVNSRDQQVVGQVHDALAPIAQAISDDFGGSWVQATGSPLVRAASLDGTSRALLISLPIAVLACLLVASLFLRSLRFGLVSVVPILMVVAWLYAFMERTGFAINLVTATIGAISIGIGIDFALHFISRFREELDRSGNCENAVRLAGEGTGLALVASTLSSVVGFGILAMAPMPLFAAYGLLTAVMVALALVASLIVLPALLVLVTADQTDGALQPARLARPTAAPRTRASELPPLFPEVSNPAPIPVHAAPPATSWESDLTEPEGPPRMGSVGSGLWETSGDRSGQLV